MRAKCAGMLIAMLLAAAGCGSDGGSGQATVTVGVVAPLDGGLTQFGLGIRNSVQLAVDEAIAAGLLPGVRLVVRAVDDSSDPDIGVRNVRRQLLDDRSVVGVIGTYNSGVAAAVAPLLAEAGIAMLSPGNTDPTLTLGPDPDHPRRPRANYFRLVAHDAQQGGVLAAYAAAALGAPPVAIVADAKPVSQGLAEDFRDAYRGASGPIASYEIVPDGDTDYAPYAVRAAAARPGLLFFGGEYDHAALLKRAAVDAGLTVALMGGDGVQADGYLAAAGAIAAGDLASSVGAPIEHDPRGGAFLAAYAAHGFVEPPSTFGPYAYDAANILLAATRDALAGRRRVTAAVRASVIATVQAADDALLAPFGGAITGAIGFDAFGDTVNPVLTVYRVEHGAWVALDTAAAD
ncbi:MAG: branched-chain amino acid ABC transporter substrate-binding protein [Deltaproteobacteria bacterium]|nr:branched-chain amino acid ABC transporter substrate-binding protein [Deltaproteobacteria bacterium]